MDDLFNSESWMIRKWRPAMAWLYMVVIAFDFILGPLLFIIIQAHTGGVIQWQPITLMAGGIFHLAMGAIVGIAAWTRGQEKVTYMDQISTIRENLMNSQGTIAETLGPKKTEPEEKEEEETKEDAKT